MSLFIKVLLVIGDIIIINLSLLFSYRWVDNYADVNHNYLYLSIFSNLSWLFIVLISTPYETTKGWAVSRIIKSQFSFVAIHIFIVSALMIFLHRNYEIEQIIVLYLCLIPSFFLFRLGTFFVRKLFVKTPLRTRYVIIGQDELAQSIRKYHLLNPDLGYEFVRYFDHYNDQIHLTEIRNYCSSHNINEIYFCVPSVNKTQLDNLIQFGLDSLIKVKLIFDAITPDWQQGLRFDQSYVKPDFSLAMISIDIPMNRIIKRSFDLVFATFVFLMILSWLIPLIALLIKLDSNGPIFFIQQRNGQSNKPFGCIKFRTMVVNNEADSKQATKNDSRITRMGKFLRKSSIDELPQFINVLKGDMSLIGPRPHPVRLNEKFQPLISNIMSRHYVKPGITGLAQCMGYRGETQTVQDMENRVRLDRYYIENWSFWLDIKIIFLTVVSLIRGSDKAY